jgi:hypothetical protein
MKKKRVSLTLPPDIWERIRTVAFQQVKARNQLIEEALRAYPPLTSKRKEK